MFGLPSGGGPRASTDERRHRSGRIQRLVSRRHEPLASGIVRAGGNDQARIETQTQRRSGSAAALTAGDRLTEPDRAARMSAPPKRVVNRGGFGRREQVA